MRIARLGLVMLMGCVANMPTVTPEPCTPGQVVMCPCPDGRISAQTCQTDGTLGACGCIDDAGAIGVRDGSLGNDQPPGEDGSVSPADVVVRDASEDQGAHSLGDVANDRGAADPDTGPIVDGGASEDLPLVSDSGPPPSDVSADAGGSRDAGVATDTSVVDTSVTPDSAPPPSDTGAVRDTSVVDTSLPLDGGSGIDGSFAD